MKSPELPFWEICAGSRHSERGDHAGGGVKPIPIDVRIVSATNRDLEELVRQDKFREDLYYRLNVVPISVPPLRDRPEDILPLIQSNLHKYNETQGNTRC